MKKFLSHLTGIVLLMTILMAGGCGSKSPQYRQIDCDDPPKKVVIEVRMHEVNGKKHLQLFESDKPDSVKIDYLHEAEVCRGIKVIWKRANNSGIKKFTEIGPVKQGGKILPKNAKKMFLQQKYKTKVPDIDIDKGTKEKYFIKFESMAGEAINIDPYLKIPD